MSFKKGTLRALNLRQVQRIRRLTPDKTSFKSSAIDLSMALFTYLTKIPSWEDPLRLLNFTRDVRSLLPASAQQFYPWFLSSLSFPSASTPDPPQEKH